MTTRKQLILEQITQNINLMKAIEQFIDVADFDPFVEARMKEFHDLRRQNGQLTKEYSETHETEQILISLELI